MGGNDSFVGMSGQDTPPAGPWITAKMPPACATSSGDPAVARPRITCIHRRDSGAVLSVAVKEYSQSSAVRAVPLVVLPGGRQDARMDRVKSPERASADLSWAELVRDIADRQDRAAFGELFAEFAPRIKALGRRMGAEPRLAEDLAQDVMLTVWRRAGQFDSRKASVSTWIYTIARNRRIDMLRRERRPEIDPTDPAFAGEAEPQPDDVLHVTRERRRMRAAMAELPPDQADMLRLAYIEDKSHQVIATELQLPLGTVKSRIRLAMTKLRAKLGDSRR